MLLSLVLRKALPGLIVFALTACSPSTPTPSLQATLPPDVTPAPPLGPTPTEAIIRLGLWLPESLAPTGDDEAARVLNAQLAEFVARYPDASLVVLPKKDHGPGGLLDLLRAASPVAPAALPDVILLSDADLAIAARDGLIQPLDDLLDASTEADLFAFARAAARLDGKRMGLPLTADVDHLVLRPDSLPAPPVDWSDLISATLSFPFAFADGAHVSDPVLVAYQALGGTIIDAEGQPALTAQALAQLLDIYRRARVAGAINLSSLDWLDPDAAWIAFRTSEATITVARASRYLAAQAGGVRLAYARTPSIDQHTAFPIGRSWNLALVTRDPRRQALAVALIQHLARPENAAAWTQAGHILPASAAALDVWGAGGDYTSFALGELNRALPPPSPAALDAVSPAFLNAIRDVLAGRAPPLAAAEAAVEAVARGEQ